MAARKSVLSVIMIAFVLSAAVPVSFAACGCSKTQSRFKDRSVNRNMDCGGICNENAWKKLGRGLCNVVTFPFELPSQISKANISDGPMAAMTWGVVKGLGMTAFRALVGVYEVVSFPVPVPDGYKPILTDPEFFFEDQIW